MTFIKFMRLIIALFMALLMFILQSIAAYGAEYIDSLDDTFIQKDKIAKGEFSVLSTLSDNGTQGCCYTENGLYVICCASSKSDNLRLRCYDSKSKEFVWDKTINGGAHGNAICFRPYDRRLYIADCFSYESRGVLKNTISVVDYDNIDAGVIEVITSPARGGIYSIAYDEKTDIFYSTNYRGSTEGNSNALFSYDGVFETVRNVVYLDDFTARFVPVHSSQGVQCVVDGIAYIPYYSPKPVIAGYDILTGKLLFAEVIPWKVDEYDVCELQSVMYNNDNKTICILSSSVLMQYDTAQTSAQHVYNAANRYINWNYERNK